MSLQLHKKLLLKKSFQYSFFTFISRILGFVREYYQIQLLGISALSDAFLIAHRIPCSLRKIFAEGALSAAFVPTFVKLMKAKKNKTAHKLMSMGFLFFEGIVLLLTILVWNFPEPVIKVMASGFRPEQMIPAVRFLRILFPLIFFVSAGALLASALQAINHFIMPAFAPVLLNMVYIGSLLVCLYGGYSLEVLCVGILLGGFFQLILFFILYFRYGFSFGKPDKATYSNFKNVLIKFANCLLGVGVMELNLIIDGNVASHLGKGSITLLYYGTRFMQIPLAIIAISFSTVLLSHLSRIAIYAPKRLGVYLLESSKFVIWATLPASLFLMFTSEKLFSTTIMARNVSSDNIATASQLLVIMGCGLLFFSINKILTSIFYSLEDTFSPALCAGIGTGVNLIGNLVSLFYLGNKAIYGIAASTVLYGIVTAVMSFILLKRKYKYKFYAANFFRFLFMYVFQLAFVSYLFWLLHNFIFDALIKSVHYDFFFYRWGYWVIVLPLAFFAGYLLFKTKKLFKLNLYFLNK